MQILRVPPKSSNFFVTNKDLQGGVGGGTTFTDGFRLKVFDIFPYLPDVEVEVKSEAGWFAVEHGEEVEEQGGNFVHLPQVGRLLNRDAGGDAQGQLLTRQVDYEEMSM